MTFPQCTCRNPNQFHINTIMSSFPVQLLPMISIQHDILLAFLNSLFWLFCPCLDPELITRYTPASGNATIKSPDFPKILDSTEPKSYLIQNEDGRGFIRMIFDDVQLPPGSYLQVMDGYACHLSFFLSFTKTGSLHSIHTWGGQYVQCKPYIVLARTYFGGVPLSGCKASSRG